MALSPIHSSTSGSTQPVKVEQTSSSSSKPNSISQQSSSSSLQQPTERHCIVRLVLSLLTSLGKIPLLGRPFKWLAQKLDPQATSQNEKQNNHSPKVQTYAKALETNLLKLAEDNKLDQPKATEAIGRIIEAFAPYQSAKENFVKLAEKMAEKIYGTTKLAEIEKQDNKIQEEAEYFAQQIRLAFPDTDVKTLTSVVELIDNVNMISQSLKGEKKNDLFTDWRDSASIRQMLGENVEELDKQVMESTEKCKSQIEHALILLKKFNCTDKEELLLKHPDFHEMPLMISSVHHLLFAKIIFQFLSLGLITKESNPYYVISEETEVQKNDFIDQARNLFKLKSSYEEELLKFGALLLPDQTNPIESLIKTIPLIESEKPDLGELLQSLMNVGGPLKTCKAGAMTVEKFTSKDLKKTVKEMNEILEEINTARLTAKNETLLTHELETLVKKFSSVLRDRFSDGSSFNLDLVEKDTEAFARAYLTHIVVKDGRALREAKDVTPESQEIVGKAFGRMVIPALFKKAYPNLSTEDALELGEILGGVWGYFNFFDAKKQTSALRAAKILKIFDNQIKLRSPNLYQFYVEQVGLEKIVDSISGKLVDIGDSLSSPQTLAKVLRQDPTPTDRYK